ncbi:MAG: hypothetical protein Q9220_004363 [cf. Caloplaca sp. 1 TL-2023]
MSVSFAEDEWDLDFSDTRAFVARRWAAVCQLSRQQLSAHDCKLIDQWPDFKSLYDNLSRRYKATRSIGQKLNFDELLQFIKTYSSFDINFIQAMSRPGLETSLIFGCLGLTIELCSGSDSRFSRVLEILSKAKRQFELFNRCSVAYEEESDMANNMVLALEKFAGILIDIIKYIHEHPSRAVNGYTAQKHMDPTESMDTAVWTPFRKDKIEPAIEAMGEWVTHIHSIAAFSTLRKDRRTAYVASKLEGTLQMQEYSHFPCVSLPMLRNQKFYGREDVLGKIHGHLDWKLNPDQPSTRTFTIYGRRGIGKTHIALEYAYQNENNFDAIFWIQCETAAALRKSFTDMALALRMPKAVQGGPHEDNLRLCHDWLRKTDKRWLLIFDNAENINLLEPYWPQSSGAILITSRSWVNFNFDPERKGATVELFNEVQRLEVLYRLLDWDATTRDETISTDDLETVQKLLLNKGGFGLGLAIQLTSSLIRAYQFRDESLRDLLEAYEIHSKKIPDRPPHDSALNTSHVVDVLYSIAFAALSPHARTLLNVLCLLSPDVTQEAIFNPKNQDVLSPMLDFCKQDVRRLATLAPELQLVIKELRDAALVKREARILSIHRVVQEAFFYLHVDERQPAFDAAVRLIDEAFPRQIHGRPLHSAWERCETYIQEVLFLAAKFEDFEKQGQPLTALPEFSELLKNAAWYLFEVGEHRESKLLLKIAFSVCEDENTLLYAHLRNTAGVVDFELNHLPLCRQSLEKALEVRRKLLEPDHEELANTINNMGNLISAEGNPKEAMEYFKEAKEIRQRLGEDSAISLAITYQCNGRALVLQRRFDEAMEQYEKAESLAVHINWSVGNLEHIKGSQRDAKRRYDQALSVFMRKTPMHILTSCTFYKLGCCEAKLGNLERALRNLERAFEIGDFRRTGLDDGNLARILWRQAEIMSDSPFDPTFQPRDIADKRAQARIMRQAVEKNIQAKIDAHDSEDIAYDKLLCGYFR